MGACGSPLDPGPVDSCPTLPEAPTETSTECPAPMDKPCMLYSIPLVGNPSTDVALRSKYIAAFGSACYMSEAGSFDCFVVEPITQSVGLFKHEGRLRVWLTADRLRMPVLMKAGAPWTAYASGDPGTAQVGTAWTTCSAAYRSIATARDGRPVTRCRWAMSEIGKFSS